MARSQILVKNLKEVWWLITGKRLPSTMLSFFYGIFMETKIYKFCTLCGPLEDAPEDADWEFVICRQCSYQEAHGMDHIED